MQKKSIRRKRLFYSSRLKNYLYELEEGRRSHLIKKYRKNVQLFKIIPKIENVNLIPWHESCPPPSWPAQRNISGMISWRPARRNMCLHLSLLTIGTVTSCKTDGSVPPSLNRPHPVTEQNQKHIH